MTKKLASSPKGKRPTKQNGNGEGTVFRSGKKWRWQLTLGYRTDGSRISISGTTPTVSAAKAALAKAIADHSRSLVAEPDRVTLQEYVETWLHRQSHVLPRSVELYRQELSYALEFFGTMRVRDIRASHLKDAVATLAKRQMKGGRGLGKPMSSRTQGKVMTRLRAVFKEAVSDQIIHANPMDGVRRIKGKAPEAVGRALDFDEVAHFRELGEALYAAGLCRLWPALFTSVNVGMRRGEVMGLAWDCVDFERGVLRVHRQLVQGKGGAKLQGDLKTQTSKREIHMPTNLKSMLRAHQQSQQIERERAGSEWHETKAVFATEFGNWVYPDNLNRSLEHIIEWSKPKKGKPTQGGIGAEKTARIEEIVRRNGPLPTFTPHDLRHTYATLALRSGVPVEVVSKKLGHARVSITLDIYRHVTDSEQLEYAIDIFAARIPKADRGEIQPRSIN